MAPDVRPSAHHAAAPHGAQYDRDFLEDVGAPALEPTLRQKVSQGVEAWRALRIQGEFVTSFDILARLGPAVAVFGSSRLAEPHPAHEQARQTARGIVAAGFAVVTGGGPGVMEGANLGAKQSGGTSVGLGIQLPFEDGFNSHVDIGVPFHYFFTRKVSFVKYTCGAVLLPGGLGTLDELFEVLTLIQTGKVTGYPVALVGTRFWAPMLDWLRGTLLAAGTISEADLDLALVTDDVAAAVAHATGSAGDEASS